LFLFLFILLLIMFKNLPPVALLALSLVAGLVLYFVISSVFKSGKKEKKSRNEEVKHSKASSHHTASSSSVSHSSSAAASSGGEKSNDVSPAVSSKPKKRKPKAKTAKPAPKPSENKFESLAMSSAAEEGDDEPAEPDSDMDDAIIPSKAAQALLKKSKAEAKLAAENKPKLDKEKEEKAKEKEEKAKKAEAEKAEKAKKAAEEAEKAEKAKKAAAKKAKKAEKGAGESTADKTGAEGAGHSGDDNLDVTNVTIPPHYDGWAVVEDKRQRRPRKEGEESDSPVPGSASAVEETKPTEDDEESLPPVPAVEQFSQEVTVDSKKLGLLIGPKGGTKLAIQNATGTTIQMPKTEKETSGDVTIVVTGPKEGVPKAAHALNELVAKGYCSLLAADDFQESYVAVHMK
jgi:hypothetical protein